MRTWLEKRSPKNQNHDGLRWGPSATHPRHPGEQNPSGSPEFVAVSPFLRRTENRKMKD
jgi:hypothetical protein